jgi:FkbM family methyltransferase
MFQHQGVWFPDGEQHLTDWMTRNGEIIDGRGTYQIKKLRAALEHCKQFRVAVDAGAHVGLWSMQLVKRFDTVHAFEPVELFRDCWRMNMSEIDGAILYPMALGATRGSVKMIIPNADTGGTHVAPPGSNVVLGREIEMRTLDSFGFGDVDLIKIDAEGFEHHIIEGARETLLRCKPCVIVEQKQHIMQRNYGTAGTPAVDLLKEMGAQVVREISGDFILVF